MVAMGDGVVVVGVTHKGKEARGRRPADGSAISRQKFPA